MSLLLFSDRTEALTKTKIDLVGTSWAQYQRSNHGASLSRCKCARGLVSAPFNRGDTMESYHVTACQLSLEVQIRKASTLGEENGSCGEGLDLGRGQ